LVGSGKTIRPVVRGENLHEFEYGSRLAPLKDLIRASSD
jgi:hypothetical protein